MSISKIFIPNFVCVVQMKYTKHIRRDFHSVTLGWDFGALGRSTTLAWGFAMAPDRLHILVSNYASGAKNGPAPGATCFTYAYKGQT